MFTNIRPTVMERVLSGTVGDVTNLCSVQLYNGEYLPSRWR